MALSNWLALDDGGGPSLFYPMTVSPAMPDPTLNDAIHQWGSVIMTGAIVGLGTLIPQLLEARKKKQSGTAWSRIERKLDVYQTETRRSVELLQIQLGEVDRTATEALHIGQGVNGENGNRGDIKKLEKKVAEIEQWQENLTLRERDRLQRIADAVLPSSPGMQRHR